MYIEWPVIWRAIINLKLLKQNLSYYIMLFYDLIFIERLLKEAKG